MYVESTLLRVPAMVFVRAILNIPVLVKVYALVTLITHVPVKEYVRAILIGHVVARIIVLVIQNIHVCVKEYAHVTMMKDITASAKLIKLLLPVQQM